MFMTTEIDGLTWAAENIGFQFVTDIFKEPKIVLSFLKVCNTIDKQTYVLADIEHFPILFENII